MKAANTMTHISMYIGETFRKQTNAIDKTTTAHDHHFIFVAFIMSMTGTPMRATTTGLMPLNAFITYSLSLKLVKNIATNNIIRNGGRQLAMVVPIFANIQNICHRLTISYN